MMLVLSKLVINISVNYDAQLQTWKWLNESKFGFCYSISVWILDPNVCPGIKPIWVNDDGGDISEAYK